MFTEQQAQAAFVFVREAQGFFLYSRRNPDAMEHLAVLVPALNRAIAETHRAVAEPADKCRLPETIYLAECLAATPWLLTDGPSSRRILQMAYQWLDTNEPTSH